MFVSPELLNVHSLHYSEYCILYSNYSNFKSRNVAFFNPWH